jgi:transposase
MGWCSRAVSRRLPSGRCARLTRHRKALVQQRTQAVNRLQKVLEGANIKLGAVASDILGKSGRDMLEALARGEQDPQTLAELARGRLRGKLPELRRALHGQVQALHRVLLQQVRAHLDFLDAAIAHLQHEIAQRLEP